jgi:hypothetical protein
MIEQYYELFRKAESLHISKYYLNYLISRIASNGIPLFECISILDKSLDDFNEIIEMEIKDEAYCIGS